MEEVRRTAVVKLDVDDSDAILLHETVEEYLWACNYVVRNAWQDDYKPTSKTKLHDRTYSEVREQTRLQRFEAGFHGSPDPWWNADNG